MADISKDLADPTTGRRGYIYIQTSLHISFSTIPPTASNHTSGLRRWPSFITTKTKHTECTGWPKRETTGPELEWAAVVVLKIISYLPQFRV